MNNSNFVNMNSKPSNRPREAWGEQTDQSHHIPNMNNNWMSEGGYGSFDNNNRQNNRKIESMCTATTTTTEEIMVVDEFKENTDNAENISNNNSCDVGGGGGGGGGNHNQCVSMMEDTDQEEPSLSIDSYLKTTNLNYNSGPAMTSNSKNSNDYNSNNYNSKNNNNISQQQQKTIEKADVYGIEHDIDLKLGMETEDIHKHMKTTECLHRTYNDKAKYLKYRRVLVDWMCEAGNVYCKLWITIYSLKLWIIYFCNFFLPGDEFRLRQSTMHVAVMYLDRILQKAHVGRDKLQLIAIVCIIIASKYEEPEVCNDLTRVKIQIHF